MAAELKPYWFVAAVFREPHDLVSTITELRGNGFAGDRLLVVANHRAEDMRKAIDGLESGRVPVVAVHHDRTLKATSSLGLPAGLRAFLDAIGEDGTVGPGGEGRSQVYSQLREDVAGGAVVLIASVDDPDEQLLGARLLLRGNCECVLTHEIAMHSG
jgi:hypothetical protein